MMQGISSLFLPSAGEGRLHIGHVLLGCFILCLSACADRKQPAPVSEVYQGRSYLDFTQQAFTGATYKVQKGDTLFAIAWYSGNDYRDIATLNKLKAPYQIFPGQVLKLKAEQKTSQNHAKVKPKNTTKINANQVVDPPVKQAYGKSEKNVNEQQAQSTNEFPDRVSAWQWPSLAVVARGFSNAEEGNKGLDFKGKLGSPIVAAADGKVVYTGNALRGFGNLVIIKHSDAYLTAYAHNEQIVVKEQEWVTSGQKIATMGKSGTDSVKLHFEVRYKGKSVDPLRFLPKR